MSRGAGWEQPPANGGVAFATLTPRGNGADDTAQINAAIAACSAKGGGRVALRAGTFELVSGAIVPKDKVELAGVHMDATLLDYSGVALTNGAKYGIKAGGVIGASTLLTVDATALTYSVTLANVVGLSVGQWVLLGATDFYPYAGAVNVPRGEQKKIFSIVGNVVTFEDFIYDTYTVANGAFVNPITAVTGIHFDGFGMIGPDDPAQDARALYLQVVDKYTVEECAFDGASVYSIALVDALRGEANGNRIRMAYYDGAVGTSFYGIYAGNATQWLRAESNHGERMRHLWVNSSSTGLNGQPRFCDVVGNVAENMEAGGGGRSWAYESHGFGDAINIVGNLADGCYGGFVTRNGGVRFDGNIVRGYYQYALEVHPDIVDAQDVHIVNNQVKQRTIEGGGAAAPAVVYVDLTNATTIRNVVVAGNEAPWTKSNQPAILVVGPSAAGVKIRDNDITPTVAMTVGLISAPAGAAIRYGGDVIVSQAQTVEQSGVAVSHTGDVLESILATIPIPAGLMGKNGSLRVTAHFSYTNSANNKTLRVRFGAAGSGVAGANVASGNVTTTAENRSQTDITNRGATNSQVSSIAGISASFQATAVAVVATAIDTTQATEINITGTLANAGETVTLEMYRVEVIPHQ